MVKFLIRHIPKQDSNRTDEAGKRDTLPLQKLIDESYVICGIDVEAVFLSLGDIESAGMVK